MPDPFALHDAHVNARVLAIECERVWQAGYSARVFGIARRHNPHHPGSTPHAIWGNGWRAADRRYREFA